MVLVDRAYITSYYLSEVIMLHICNVSDGDPADQRYRFYTPWNSVGKCEIFHGDSMVFHKYEERPKMYK